MRSGTLDAPAVAGVRRGRRVAATPSRRPRAERIAALRDELVDAGPATPCPTPSLNGDPDPAGPAAGQRALLASRAARATRC